MAIFLSSPTPSFNSAALSQNTHNPNKVSRPIFNRFSFHGIHKNFRHLPVSRKSCLLVNNIPRFIRSEGAAFSSPSSLNAGADVWGSNFDENTGKKDYPMIRSFENDLCRLTLIGYRSLEEAIAAAAADGGITAAEHVASGRSLMVIETIYPGYSSEHSTVSTRLLVPANKVLEKAKRTAVSSMPSDNLSRNMLATAFRKVVMQLMWEFELLFFNPGTQRDMNDLAASRQVEELGSLTTSDEKLLTGLAEAVCFYAAACMKDDFQRKMLGKSSKTLFQFFQKPKWMPSSDFYVRIRPLSKSEISAHIKTWLKKIGNIQERQSSMDTRTSHNWWPWPSHLSSFPNTSNVESKVWANEYLPVHKLQIDVNKFKNVKFQGGQECSVHIWEIDLSHHQLVELADVLDMYYEDPSTCPGRQLQPRIVLDAPKFAMSKITLSLWRALFASLAGGIALVSLIVASRLWKTSILKPGIFPLNSMILSSPHETLEGCSLHQSNKAVLPQNENVSAEEMEALCIMIVQIVKNALKWPGDIQSCSGKGVWIGQNLTEWGRSEDKNPTNVVMEDGSGSSIKMVENMNDSGQREGLKDAVAFKNDTSSQDHIQDNLQEPNAYKIAVYEVTLSRNGNLIGFKPTNRAAVNRWASNPLTKVLYDGRKLQPGLLERRLKFRGPPKDAVIIELLISDDPAFQIVTARPSQI